MYAVLGNIEFDLITYFDGLEQRSGSDFAEHGRIGGKPVLQFVGDKLDEIRIDLVLHAAYCQPDEELKSCRRRGSSIRRWPWCWATAITKAASSSPSCKAPAARPTAAATCWRWKPSSACASSVATRRPSQTSAGQGRRRRRRQAQAAGRAGALQGRHRRPGQGGSQVKSVVGKVKTVINTARDIRQLAGRDPAAALEKLPGLLKEVQAVAPGLQVSAEQMAKFEQYSKLAGDAVRVGQSLQQAKLNMSAMGRLLAGTGRPGAGQAGRLRRNQRPLRSGLARTGRAAGRLAARRRILVTPCS